MSSIGSPKIIPRVHLSPKIKQRVRNQRTFSPKQALKKFSPKRKMVKRMSPKKSPQKIINKLKSPSRTKLFISQRESFRKKPTVNPVTNRTIKIDGDTYHKLVKIYGKPY